MSDSNEEVTREHTTDAAPDGTADDRTASGELEAVNDVSNEGSESAEGEASAGGDTAEDTADAGESAVAEEPEEAPDAHKPYKVATSRDMNTAFLSFDPQKTEELPHAGEIIDIAKKKGIPEDALFSVEKLDQALKNTVLSGIPLENYPICEDKDASFEITTNDDKTKALLTIKKGRGQGKPLVLKELGAAIRTSGLKGMDLARIKEDILSFYRSPQLVLENYVLAEGKPPQPGKPRELTWEVSWLDEEKVAKQKKLCEEAPWHPEEELPSVSRKPIAEIEEMAFVKAESIIASISPVDKGTPGVDVYGKQIDATGGTEAPVETLEHVRLDTEAIVAERDGIVERWQEDSVPICRVRPHRDATVSVNISEDVMLASVSLTEGTGSGLRLSTELVRQRLIDAGVIKGIDLHAVEEAVRSAVEENSRDEVVVARGEPPTETGEARLKFHINLASGKSVTIRDDGTADFKNQDRITTVDKDTLIAEVVSPDFEKKDGWDVRSKTVKAKDSQHLQIEAGAGIRKERDDAGMLKFYADTSGELIYDGTSLVIQEVHTVKGDIGTGTGNVKFSGPVNIAGGVRSGYYVMAKGTVKIADGVEAALVSSEGSIHVQQGIKGGGKAVLRAKDKITAAFAEQATLMTIGDVVLQNTCLHCEVKCNGSLMMETENGKLVGGIIKVRNGLVAAQLGTKTGVQTEISFGQDMLIRDKIELEEREIEKLQNQIAELDGTIRLAEKEKRQSNIEKGRKKKVQCLKLIEKRGERLFWLRERFEQHFSSAIKVQGAVYPGVVLESHGRILEITNERRNVSFSFNQESGHIEETPLSES